MVVTREFMDTGYPSIDEQHRAIGAQLRALTGAVNADDVEASVWLMRTLEVDVATHFAHEERLMREWAYPNYGRHHDAHESFLEDAARFGAQLRGSGITHEFRTWVLQRLAASFQLHIIANDVELGLYLRRHVPQTIADIQHVRP
jgi:hemerythrin